MQLSHLFHQVATDAESNGLKELATKFGCPEDKVIVIAVNRMFLDTFHPDIECDYPTDEDLARWKREGLIERSTGPEPGSKTVSSLKDLVGKE